MRDYSSYFNDRVKLEKRGVSIKKNIDWWMGYAASHIAKLLFLGLLAVLFLVIQLFIQLVNNEQRFPVDKITLTGDVFITQPKDIEGALSDLTVASFFKIDINEISTKIESLPWIESATVMREWPNRLNINVHERQASYRWGDKELVDESGNRFANIDNRMFSHLPKVSGLAGHESEVILAYQQLMQVLGESANHLDIEAFVLNQYLSWELHLRDGLVIKFGRDDYTQRIKRFADVYQMGRLPDFKQLHVVDFRYHRGFAVKWKPEFTPQKSADHLMKVAGTEI